MNIHPKPKTQSEITLDVLSQQYGGGIGIINITIRNKLEPSILNTATLIDNAYRCVEDTFRQLGVKTKSTMPVMGLGAGGGEVDPTLLTTIAGLLFKLLPWIITFYRYIRHKCSLMRAKIYEINHPRIEVRFKVEEIEDPEKAKVSLRYLAFMLDALDKSLSSTLPHIDPQYQLLSNISGVGKVCISVSRQDINNKDSMNRLARKINKIKYSWGNIIFIYPKNFGYKWKIKPQNIVKKHLLLFDLDLFAKPHP